MNIVRLSSPYAEGAVPLTTLATLSVSCSLFIRVPRKGTSVAIIGDIDAADASALIQSRSSLVDGFLRSPSTCADQ